MSALDGALGIIRIANSNMLNALKLISVRKGYDPSDFSIVATGGGGPMHATSLAKDLGVKKVIIPIAASVFSAWGMLMTDLRNDYIKTYITKLTKEENFNLSLINYEFDLLEKEALSNLKQKNFKNEEISLHFYFDMRYLGQEHTVKVPLNKKGR